MSIVREKALAARQGQKEAEEALREQQRQEEAEREVRERRHVMDAFERAMGDAENGYHPLRAWFGPDVNWTPVQWTYPRGRAREPGQEFLPVVYVIVTEEVVLGADDPTEMPYWWVDIEPTMRPEARMAIRTPGGRWERGTVYHDLMAVGRYFEDQRREMHAVADS